MSIKIPLTFFLSSLVLVSFLTIKFLPSQYLSIILTMVCIITLLQLFIQKPTPPLWIVLYVISIIFFLCLKEILGTFNLFKNINLEGTKYYYSNEVYNKALIYVFYYVSGTYFAIVFLSKKMLSISNFRKNNSYNLKTIKVLFIICFLFMLFDKFSTYSNSNIVGYVESIHSNSTSSPFFSLIDILFPIIYSFIAIAYCNKKISFSNLSIFTLIFFTPYFFTFLSGFRGEFAAKLIALVIIYSSIIKIPKYYYLIGGSTLLIGVLAMEFIRFDQSLSIFTLPIESYFLAFSYFGNSFDVIPLTIQYQDYLFHSWKYFFGGPLAIFSFESTYSAQGIISKPYLAQHLMYVIDYKRFYGGSTIGSSVVAETFLFSPYLIFPLSFIILQISKLLLNKTFNSILYFYISFSYFQNLLFIPRGGFLKFINKEFFIGVLIISFLYSFKYIYKKYAQ